MKIYRPSVIATAIMSTFCVAIQVQANDLILEEVVVTAQKRAQSMSDIGVTITAFGGDDIKELGFTKAQDIASQTPGLSTANATSSGTPIFAIRGVGLDDFNSNNTSGVGVYIDQVLAAYPVFLNGRLFDVERVEVLKGPQGTLYGKNTTGGAINYVSVKPSNEFEGYLTVGVSRWNARKVESAVSGALGDSVNSRLALFANRGDGWQKDIETGREFGETDSLAVRSLTTFQISDDTEILLNLHYTKDDAIPVSPQNLTIDTEFGLPAGTLGVVSGSPRSVRVGNLNVGREEEGYGASVDLNVDFESFTLTSITAIDTYERKVIDNYDGTAINTDDFTFSDEFDVYSQEFRLTSNAGDGFSWVAGLSYSYDKIDAQTTADVGALAGVILGDPSIVSSRTQSEYSQVSKSFGAFLHTETELTDVLTLTVGLRYSEDVREFDGQSVDLDGLTALFSGSSIPVPGLIVADLDDRETESNLSGKIGLDYALNEDWLFYSSVSNSYKAGVFYASPAGDASALSYIEPEEILAYELGFKGSMLNNTMQVNGAFYHYQYDGRQSQVNAISPSIPGLIFATLGNVEESEMSGGELEFRWLPVQGLDVRAGVSYIDSEVIKAPDTVRGLSLATPIEAGVDLAQAPQWSYSAVVRYEWPLFDLHRATAQAQYSWTDEQVSSLAGTNVQYGTIDALGLRFSLEPDDGSWQLSAWVANLENRNSNVYSFTSTEGGQVVYRQIPRNYGVEWTYSF